MQQSNKNVKKILECYSNRLRYRLTYYYIIYTKLVKFIKKLNIYNGNNNNCKV